MPSNYQFSSAAPLLKKVRQHKAGQSLGMYSICSANREVLKAAMQLHKKTDQPILIEATCNQVNQEGGYTGMTPRKFTEFIRLLAEEIDFPIQRIILGGDHLGPNPWKKEAIATAMQKAEQLVREYVDAGFSKIHLDASMSCGQEGQLTIEEIAERTTQLCKRSEKTFAENPHGQAPVYIIGTEVPSPGGLTNTLSGAAHVSRVEDVRQTIDSHHEIFLRDGLESAVQRVIAIVVSPGVEFGNSEIYPYVRESNRNLCSFIEKQPGWVFEAHSTDYQSPTCLRKMVEDHFAILKVGPALTFAFREAIFRLAAIENELPEIDKVDRSQTVEVLLKSMQASPAHWKEHYSGSNNDISFAMKYSFSDRARYYWGRPDVRNALEKLFRNLGQRQIPMALISQFFPSLFPAVNDKAIPAEPNALLDASIAHVLQGYQSACSAISPV